jgi:hypothetical protein
MAPDKVETVPLELDPKYDDYDFPLIAAVPQTGHAGHLTQAQQAQVFQLRMMLEGQGYKDRLDTLTLVTWTGQDVADQGN